MGARSGPAFAMFASAQRATSLARRTGMDVDEAADTVRGGLNRRHLLAGAGAAALGASLSTVWSEPASATADSRARVLVVGSGIAGLECAYRLWRTHGIRAHVYEWANRPGGRIRTLRNHFDDGRLVEEHGEFINPEHTATLALAKHFGLRLDNADRHPPGPNPDQETFRFNGNRFSQARLNRDWHRFGYRLFHDAAVRKAPFPTRFDRSTHWGRRWDHMSVAEWLDAEVPGGSGGDFGQLCISAVLEGSRTTRRDQWPADSTESITRTRTARNIDGVASSTRCRGSGTSSRSSTSSGRSGASRGSVRTRSHEPRSPPATTASSEPTAGSSVAAMTPAAADSATRAWPSRRRANRCCDQPPAALRPCTCRVPTFDATSRVPSNTPAA